MDRTPFLTGNNVDLYPVEEEDLERLRDIVNHPAVWTWISVNAPQNLRSEEQFLEQLTDNDDQITVLIYSKEEESVCGTIEIRIEDDVSRVAELGIMLDADHHSKGIGTEATELMLEYAFEQINLHKVWARVLAHNEKSLGLLRKLGFTEEGRMREHSFNDGEYKDFALFGILASEWQN